MRIAFVAGRYWPATGGAENLIRHVARQLAARHAVTVIADRIDDAPHTRLSETIKRPAPFEPFKDGKVQVTPLALSPSQRALLAPLAAYAAPGLGRFAFGRNRITMMNHFARVVSPALRPYVHQADVIHTWTVGYAAAAAARLARRDRIPLVLTPFVHRGQWGDDPASKRLLRSADRVVGLLDIECDTFHQMGVAPERIRTCGACAPSAASSQGDRLRFRHAITGPLVLFLGVRRPYKGYELLLDAADDVAAQIAEVTFAFVGPGDPLRTVTTARVLDIGSVDDAERGGWLEAADVLCLPSDHEIFPISILEAWSVCTAVLTSDIPTLVELIDRSHGGVAVARDRAAIASALIDLLVSPAKRARLAAAGNVFWREHHTPGRVAALYEDIYRELRR